MKLHSLTGIIYINGQELQSEFSTMIHQSGYFYARSEAKLGISQIQIHVRPFTAHMLIQHPIEPETSLVYELQGNRIGHVRFGSDNADGAWRTWDLSKAFINVTRFTNGLSIRFEICTIRGAWTSEGSIDKNTIGTVAPVDYWFELFVPKNTLEEFLRGEHEEWINPNDLHKKFVDLLSSSGLKTYKV
jgi:hypothetical protein